MPPTDRCAICFRPLVPAPLAGRYACTHPSHRGTRRRPYWSEAIPEAPAADASLVSRHGRPTLHLFAP